MSKRPLLHPSNHFLRAKDTKSTRIAPTTSINNRGSKKNKPPSPQFKAALLHPPNLLPLGPLLLSPPPDCATPPVNLGGADRLPPPAPPRSATLPPFRLSMSPCTVPQPYKVQVSMASPPCPHCCLCYLVQHDHWEWVCVKMKTSSAMIWESMWLWRICITLLLDEFLDV